MKIEVKRIDTIWGYLSTIVSMTINLIMLPFILRYLNPDDVGMYYIFTSLSMLVSFFDFGFGPAFARSISYAWSGANTVEKEGGSYSTNNEPNYGLLKKLFVTCQIFYGIVALTALILALTIGTAYIGHVSGSSGNEYILAWCIYASAIFINLLFDYYSSLLRGIGAIRCVNKAMVIGRVIQIIACVLLLKLGMGLLGVAIAYFLYGIVFRIIAKIYFDHYKNVKKKIKENNYQINKNDIWATMKILWPNTWKEGVVTVSNYIANQGTTLICSLFLTLQQTGLYSLTTQVVQAIVTIASALYTTYQPALQSAYANQDKENQRKLFSTIIATYVTLFFLGMLALITIGRPVIKIINPEYELEIWVVIGVGIYQFILKYRNCYATYFSSTNRVIYYKAYFVSAIIGVILSYTALSAFDFGIAGLIIPQIISQLIFNAWYWARKAHLEMGLTSFEVMKIGVNELINMYLPIKKKK